MKFNKISMVLAALAFVGCSSEDLNEFAATPAAEDSNLIQLGSDFVLAGVGAEGTTTRTHWEWEDPATKKKLVNKFLPIYTAAPGGLKLDKYVDPTAQSVGLCWLGQSVGTDVYTNYQFYHFGWLNNGQDKATFECNELKNGSLYSEITVGTGAAGDEAQPADWGVAGLPTKSVKSAADNLNYNSGIYKTENKAIFGGKYIVYYPYNENFKDAGTIPAVAKTNWTPVPTDMNSPEVGRETFRYSAPVDIEGGNQATNFGLNNLSALVQLRVAAAKGYAGTTTFDKIVLFSAKKQLLKQANLAADKIAAGNEGTELYTETEGTKTIVATFGAPQALTATDLTVTSAYITALPTTVEDLVVFVHGNVGGNGKWAKVSLPNTEFKAHSGKVLNITVADADFKDDFIAIDQTSLETALTEANALAIDADHAQTITVIGDIALNSNLAIDNVAPLNLANSANITIKGDDIIVPEAVTLTLNTKMESNVRVLGKSCCSTAAKGGRLEVKGGTVNNITMEKTEAAAVNDNTNPEVKYTGEATIAAGKTVEVKAGNVIVNAKVNHKGDIKIAEGAKVTVNGTDETVNGALNFMGSNVTNDGTIEVKKGGKFDMTAKNGGATAEDGKRMTNNGTFIHNVDAGVGTAVQSMNQNGEYRCKVDKQIKLDDAFLQWTACSVIEMVNTTAVNYNLGTAAKITTPYQHNGKYIDIEVNSGAVTTFNNPLDANSKADDNEIMIGNLTVNAGGLKIDYVKDNLLAGDNHKIYKRTLTVNGNMTVAANTEFTSSKKINITKNLTVKGGKTLKYKGAKANEDGLAVTKDITVNGNNSTFDANEVDALNITCANFYLKSKGKAMFGNRTDGAAKNMVVSGTIDNPANCTFTITAANQDGAGSVLAWVTCKELKVGGTFTGAQPRVE